MQAIPAYSRWKPAPETLMSVWKVRYRLLDVLFRIGGMVIPERRFTNTNALLTRSTLAFEICAGCRYESLKMSLLCQSCQHEYIYENDIKFHLSLQYCTVYKCCFFFQSKQKQVLQIFPSFSSYLLMLIIRCKWTKHVHSTAGVHLATPTKLDRWAGNDDWTVKERLLSATCAKASGNAARPLQCIRHRIYAYLQGAVIFPPVWTARIIYGNLWICLGLHSVCLKHK